MTTANLPPEPAPRSHAALAAELIAGLDASYDLVYVDRGDGLTDEQVAAVVRNDYEKLWDSTGEWESDSRWQAVTEIIKNDARDVVNRWEREDGADYDDLLEAFDSSTDEWERVREAIEERDSGDWLRQLARQTGDVLLRIRIDALDEDHAIAFRDVESAEVIGMLGITDDAHNREAIGYALANASPEFSVLMGYWIVGADVEALFDLSGGDNAMVEIDGPYLYLGNPFTGGGFITEEPLRATVRVRRGDLRTDKDAFGYSVDNIYGGLRPRDFAATITAVAPADAQAGQEAP